MQLMVLQVFRAYQDIDEVDQDILVENIPEDIIHKLLKNCRNITEESKQNHQILKVVIPVLKVVLHSFSIPSLIRLRLWATCRFNLMTLTVLN